MTPEQFSALAALMGQTTSKSAAAARLVLVEGLSSAERPGASASRRRERIWPCNGAGGGSSWRRWWGRWRRGVAGGSCGLHHSANKHDSCCRSLKRNNTISAAL